MFFLNNFSIEIIIVCAVAFLCITTLGINVFIRQQILYQKQVHINEIQKLNIQIRTIEKNFASLMILKEENLKSQEVFASKMNLINVKCLDLYKVGVPADK